MLATEPDIAGYYSYIGLYINEEFDIIRFHTNTRLVINDLSPGKFYIYVTAVDKAGNESLKTDIMEVLHYLSTPEDVVNYLTKRYSFSTIDGLLIEYNINAKLNPERPGVINVFIVVPPIYQESFLSTNSVLYKPWVKNIADNLNYSLGGKKFLSGVFDANNKMWYMFDNLAGYVQVDFILE